MCVCVCVSENEIVVFPVCYHAKRSIFCMESPKWPLLNE